MTIVTKDNYNVEVESAEGLVVIDFWAAWCGPCRMLSPIIDQLDESVKNVKFCKVNVDEEAELSRKFGVMSIPTVVFMIDGNIAQTLVGYRSKEELLAIIGEYV